MSREFGRPTSPRSGDQLAEAPDSTRPRNPWPRLLAFFSVVGLAVVMTGYCLVSFASAPPRELKVEVESIEPGVPRFIPVTTWGADDAGFTFGAFLVVDPSVGVVALLSQEPESNCNLAWDAAAGAFVDRCSDARYDLAGVALHEGATRNLHRFAVERTTRDYVVSVGSAALGECRSADAAGCAPAGEAVTVTLPSGALPAGFPAQ
ncbi:MAG: hypothetical protein AMXMBFR23_18460 [Chloroflexota bacterium]